MRCDCERALRGKRKTMFFTRFSFTIYVRAAVFPVSRTGTGGTNGTAYELCDGAGLCSRPPMKPCRFVTLRVSTRCSVNEMKRSVRAPANSSNDTVAVYHQTCARIRLTNSYNRTSNRALLSRSGQWVAAARAIVADLN